MSTYDYSASEAYIVNLEAVERVFMAIPPEHRRRPRVLKQEIRIALADLNRNGHASPAWPVDHLIARILAYLASPESASKYFRELTTWLSDGGYDEPDAAWRTRDRRASDVKEQRHKAGVEKKRKRRLEETG